MPLGAGRSLENAIQCLLVFSLVLLFLPLAGFVVGLLIAAGVSLWRLHFRRLASSIFGIAAIPVCFAVVAAVPLFDPWLWYAIANNARFEAVAAIDSPLSGPKYAVVEGRDVTHGMVGGANHFVLLIYDESDTVGLEPSERPSIWQTRSISPEGAYRPIPRGQRLYGHLFKVDDFE